MSFTAIIHLNWSDPKLSWNRKEFPSVNRVTFPSDKIWTPSLFIWNAAYNSNNIQHSGDNLFISADGQVHWPIFGYFRTSCTLDVTYYPFDQQVCIVKIGTFDRTIQIDYYKNSIDLEIFYMSVYWSVIEAPAYQNVYRDEELPAEIDVTYYLIIRRRTHWLSEVCPLLAFAFITIIPAVLRRPLEKLILQAFCIAGLSALHMEMMSKLPPTSLANPLASKYVVALISFNLIHLTLIAITNNRRGYFQWIQKLTKRISRITQMGNDKKGKKTEQNIEIKHNLSNASEGQTKASGRDDKIVAIFNWFILVLLILVVVISTLYFLFGHPH